MGGAGYSEDALVESCCRRTRGWMIAGGAIEILLNRIAEGVFDRRFSQRAQEDQRVAPSVAASVAAAAESQ